MIHTILSSVSRATAAYLLLLTVTRLMGRKAVSQMTFFDLAVVMTLGSVTANMGLEAGKMPVTAATVLVTLGALAIITAYVNIKSIWARKIINSEPVTAIENGRIINNNLEKIRLTLGELTTMLREKNIFNLADVEFAIIENDGQLSVLPKSQKAPLTPSDLNLPTSYKGLSKDLVMDGKILGENLHSVKLDENWLKAQLTRQGIYDVSRVFYAGLDSGGTLYISVKQPDTP